MWIHLILLLLASIVAGMFVKTALVIFLLCWTVAYYSTNRDWVNVVNSYSELLIRIFVPTFVREHFKINDFSQDPEKDDNRILSDLKFFRNFELIMTKKDKENALLRGRLNDNETDLKRLMEKVGVKKVAENKELFDKIKNN